MSTKWKENTETRNRWYKKLERKKKKKKKKTLKPGGIGSKRKSW